MADRKMSALEVHRLLSEHAEVQDLYKGDCRGCGQCCSRFLPLTVQEEFVVGGYMKKHGIKPRPMAEYDLTCPFLTEGKECAIYEARPEICRVYRCDMHKAKTLPAPKGWRRMRTVDILERFGGRHGE